MKVYFIGAGPGAWDLITIRGANLLKQCRTIMYAGSLVPQELLRHCASDAVIINTAELALDDQERYFVEARDKNWDVARLHSGDPAIYGATAEQMRRLDKLNIAYEIVPGVSSFTAGAAAIGSELTKPGVSQTIILTRLSGRASSVPDTEDLSKLAATRATLCIFLSGPHLKRIIDDVSPFYSADTPIALVHRVTQEQERTHVSTLGRVLAEVNPAEWALTTLVLIGDVLADQAGGESCLYSDQYTHKFRRATVDAR